MRAPDLLEPVAQKLGYRCAASRYPATCTWIDQARWEALGRWDRLTGKVAIVTGAASQGDGVGNGAAVAMLFAREGARVVLVNRSLERAKALEETIRSEGGEAAAIAADVTQPEATQAMAAFAVERYGRLDILHNNVGVGAGGNTVTVSLDDWDRLVQSNLTSAMLCCRACIPRMQAGGGGSIVNVSSTAGMIGLSGTPGAVAYAATKAGLQGLDRCRSRPTMRRRRSAPTV